MSTLRARLAALGRRLLVAEPAELIQYVATVVAALGTFGIAVPLGLDAKIGAVIVVAVAVRDIVTGRATRAAVWSPDSVARLQEAAKTLGAPADKVDAAAALIASGQLDALHELLVAFDPPGEHAAK